MNNKNRKLKKITKNYNEIKTKKIDKKIEIL